MKIEGIKEGYKVVRIGYAKTGDLYVFCEGGVKEWVLTENSYMPLIIVEKIEPRYKVGSRFLVAGETYILARVKVGHYALINLENGNRLRDPIKIHRTLDTFSVKDIGEIAGTHLTIEPLGEAL